MTRSALPHSEVPRRPAESEDRTGESWMPEIGTFSLMSGDWQRNYGANATPARAKAAGNSKASRT